MFDISKLNKSSFRGIPFYTQSDDASGSQRLTDHAFINGGTKTESNGINNDFFKINAYIGGDDYLIQKEALREAFKDLSSGVLVDKFYGTLEVYVDSWSIKESIKAFGRADIEVTFKLSENKVIEDTEIVFNASARKEALVDFADTFDNQIGSDLLDSVAKDITKFWDGVLGTIKFLEDKNDALQNIKTQVGRTITTIKVAILSIDSLSSDILNFWGTFDEVLDLNLFGPEDQKGFTNTIRQLLGQSSSGTSDNLAQEKANIQSQIYINTVIAGLTETAIKNLENVDFNTGDDLGSVKDDILSIYDGLESEIIFDVDDPIEKILSKQALLDKYQLARKEFIEFYTQKYSGLQSLKDVDVVATVNVFDLTMNRYDDIKRSTEVLTNNDLVDPLFISGTLKLLDR